MALVLIAALCMALLFVVFKWAGRTNAPLLPVIVINYAVACAWGLGLTLPWRLEEVRTIAGPAALIGSLFILFFYITAMATQRVGVAVSTVASKMSLVLTVLFSIAVFGDRPGATGWMGIVLAFAAVAASAWPSNGNREHGTSWLLPLILFIGTAIVDISLASVQRKWLDAGNSALFQTMVFATAGAIGLAFALYREPRPLLDRKAWACGAVLGSINYASVHAIIAVLDRSGYAPSTAFPLMNAGVILIGSILSVTLLGERLRSWQWIGVACAMSAMALLLND